MSRNIVLAAVYCRLCKAEGRDQPGKLGEVVKLADRRINWHGEDARFGREVRKRLPDLARPRLRSGQTLAAAAYGVTAPPAEVTVYCRHHKERNIPGARLLAARGRKFL